jgi:hypothetical protein
METTMKSFIAVFVNLQRLPVATISPRTINANADGFLLLLKEVSHMFLKSFCPNNSLHGIAKIPATREFSRYEME